MTLNEQQEERAVAEKLSDIQNIDLREVWPNEATDFTPWLAENITKLGEALGAITDSPETLKEIQDWTIERLLKFKQVFGPRLKDLVDTL